MLLASAKCQSFKRVYRNISQMSYTTSAPETVQDDVIFTNANNSKIVTLNRPKKLNSLNQSMIAKLLPRLVEYSKSDLTKLIIQNSNGRAFCAGGDVASCVLDNTSNKVSESVGFFREEYSLNLLLATYPKPIVSLLNGITMGGGVGLSIHTPFRVATENTRWAMPEMDIGFSPDVGTTFALSRIIPSYLGWYLALTGEEIKGFDNYFIGLATHYVPSKRIDELTKELISADSNSGNIYEVINSIIESYSDPLPESYKFKLTAEEISLLAKVFHKDSTVESIIQDLAKNGSKFAKETVSKLEKKSPLSLKVALEILQRGSQSSIYESLNNELIAAKQFMKASDFNEGVTSKLIKKSKDVPNWRFKTISEVPIKQILKFFKADPSLTLKAFSVSNFYNYPYNFGLPKEEEVFNVVNALDAGKRERKDVIKKFVNNERYSSKIGLVDYLNFILDSRTSDSLVSNIEWKL